jgi:hypothetical protein
MASAAAYTLAMWSAFEYVLCKKALSLFASLVEAAGLPLCM